MTADTEYSRTDSAPSMPRWLGLVLATLSAASQPVIYY